MVATGENFSCKSLMIDALRLNDESAAGNSKKEDSDEKKGKVVKVKPKEVNMTEKQSDSGSDSSWFVQDANKTIEEAEAKWVAGDGFNDEDTVVEDPANQ